MSSKTLSELTSELTSLRGTLASQKQAAQDNGVLFNPIVAGDERESWRNVLEVSADKYREGSFRGQYMDGLVEKFMNALADTPVWKVK